MSDLTLTEEEAEFCLLHNKSVSQSLDNILHQYHGHGEVEKEEEKVENVLSSIMNTASKPLKSTTIQHPTVIP